MKKQYFIPITIYLIAFTIILWYGLNHPLVNDGVKEYLAYQQNIDEGWTFRLTLVNSCVITTYIPALLFKWFGGNELFIFRLIPALLYSLMPVFTYLIARKYLNYWKSILATLMVLLSSYFMFFPDIGRVGVGIAFMAGCLWALLNKRMVWLIIFSILVVFAHYGSALVFIGVLGIATLLKLLFYRKDIKYFLISLVVVSVLTGVWHFGIAGYSGDVMKDTLLQSERTGYAALYGATGNETVIQVLLDPTTREPAVQEALFLDKSILNAPKNIEILSNWGVVLLVVLGLISVLRNKELDKQFKILSVSSFILIILTIFITWLSIYYGGMRVYFSTSMLLATCFVFGLEKMSKWTRIPIIVLGMIILVLYGLSTSGLIYNIFGLNKWLPVVISLQG